MADVEPGGVVGDHRSGGIDVEPGCEAASPFFDVKAGDVEGVQKGDYGKVKSDSVPIRGRVDRVAHKVSSFSIVPNIVDQGLYAIFYVKGEASDREQVVGVGWVEGGSSKGYCWRGPDASVEEELLLGIREVVCEEGGGEAIFLIRINARGWGRYPYPLGAGDLRYGVKNPIFDYVVEFGVSCCVAKGDDEELPSVQEFPLAYKVEIDVEE